MSMDWAECVAQFQLAQGHIVKTKPISISPEEIVLRMRLMNEELGELAIAMHENNPEKILDAICDLAYVVVGTGVAYGYGPILDAAFREVHRSNMTKDSIRREQYGKGGIKGMQYEPPNLEQFLK